MTGHYASLWHCAVASPRLAVSQHRALWSADFPRFVPLAEFKARPSNQPGHRYCSRRGADLEGAIWSMDHDGSLTKLHRSRFEGEWAIPTLSLPFPSRKRREREMPPIAKSPLALFMGERGWGLGGNSPISKIRSTEFTNLQPSFRKLAGAGSEILYANHGDAQNQNHFH